MTNEEQDTVRRAFVAMLRHCADYIASLPVTDVDAILNGDLELQLSVVAKRAKPNKKSSPTLDPEKLKEISTRLRSLDNRADGERLIRDNAPTRAALETLAKHLDVAVRRDDRVDSIARRIVEATIGFRLSSAAVQGRSTNRPHEETISSYPLPTKDR